MPADNPQGTNRTERVLANMLYAVGGVSLLALVAVLVLGATGAGADLGGEAWYRLVVVLPLVGLPITVLLIVAVVILNLIRRRRETTHAR